MAKEVTMKRFFALLMVCTMLLYVVPLNAVAEDSKQVESIDIVLLLDVSTSMNTCDKENPDTHSRVSTEAAQMFAFMFPYEVEMNIKLIPYNGIVYDGFDSLNVSTTEGLKQYVENIELVLSDNRENDVLEDISCWFGYTDIGAAMEAGAKSLLDSEADKKAMILFTDGCIATQDKSGVEVSHKKANDTRDALEDAGVPIYCVGLNADGSVDEEFLKSMSDSEKTEGKTVVVTSAPELTEVFQEIYTYLFDNSRLNPNNDVIEVNPEVEEEKTIHIYGQAVKEANITLTSGALLHSIRILTPSGVPVADVDYVTEKNRVSEEHCAVNATPSHSTVTIKLKQPEDGNWVLAVKGEESSVMVSKIYLFDLKVKDSISDGGNVCVDGEYKFDATIYNAESNVHVSSTSLYEGEDGAKAVANIVNTTTHETKLIGGELNDHSNGFDFSVAFDKPGTYRLDITITHAQFEIESSKTIEVVAPTLGIERIETGNEDKFDLRLTLTNPVSGEKINTIPKYLNDASGRVIVKSNDKVFYEQLFDAADIATGSCDFSFEASAVGEYTATATLANYTSTLDSGEISLTVGASTISVNDDAVSSIEKSGLSADFKEVISIEDLFIDSDGDALVITVESLDEDIATAEIDGDELIIRIREFGKTEVVLKATDNNGAEATYTISVEAESTMGLVIGLAIAAAVILIGVIVFLIIVNKRKVIRFGFKIKITSNDEDGKNNSAVFNIGRLASNRHAKPTMKLDALLSSNNAFAQILDSNFNADELDAFIAKCEGISITGLPFKRAFKIEYNKKKRGTFVRNQIMISLSDGSGSVTFGSVNDFNDSDGYSDGYSF